MTGSKKIYIALISLIVLVISGLSAWRFLAILGLEISGWATWLAICFGVTLGFILFWLTTLAAIRYFKRNLSPQQWLSALVGAALVGFLGLLLATPAGLSRITLELQAENVWNPNIFTAIWSQAQDKHGLEWHTPFSLPTGKATPVTLELTATGQHNNSADLSEVWLVGAVWPTGEAILADEFQAGGGWERQEINWGDYQNESIWLSRQNQPATLSWAGSAPGPLTLIFARHNQAGEVTIRWNGLIQTLDLYAPDVEFQGLTLPVAEALVWRASLPVSALAQEISILVEPDPGDGFPATLKKISITGIPGQSPAVTGNQLSQALRFETGFAISTPTGIKFAAKKISQLPRATLIGVLAPYLSWAPLISPLENGLLVLYLAVIGGIIIGVLASLVSPDILTNVNILIISIMVALGIGEVALRAYLPPADKYYVWQPHLQAIFNPNSEVLSGIEGQSHFIVNSQGFRGDEFSAEHDYRILTIGGSTTECLYLDQTEAWPQLLQTGLNEAQNRPVWVGNAGKSGLNTREHLLQMKYLLPQYPDLEAVILLIGGNDFNLRLIEGDSYKPNYLDLPGTKQKLLKRAFSILPRRDANLRYYESIAIWRLINRIEQSQVRPETIEKTDTEDNAGEVYITRRKRRKNALLEDELPDLAPGLTEYSRNVNSLIDIAQAHNVRLILMTQPTLWRADLSQAEKDLLWLGWQPGHQVFYSAKALAQGMSIYNKKLLEICDQRQVECIDLAKSLPKDTTVFYDGVHFNESGATQVSRIVADYLLRHPPFALEQ